jgi:hypothetical protein
LIIKKGKQDLGSAFFVRSCKNGITLIEPISFFVPILFGTKKIKAIAGKWIVKGTKQCVPNL